MASLKAKELIRELMQAVRNQEHPEHSPGAITETDLFNRVASAREKLEDYIYSVEKKAEKQ